jgi:exonuclease SbcC
MARAPLTDIAHAAPPMRLTRLTARAFRLIADADVTFPDGLIGIAGANGTGKTSLAEAVAFALFGADALRTGKEDVVGPGDEDLVVRLDFSIGDQQCAVTREIRRKNLAATATLEIDGAVIARGVEAVSSEVSRLIGGWREFSMGRFVAQKQLNALSTYAPAERKRLILRLLGIADVEEAAKKLRADGLDLERTIKARQAVLPAGDELRAAIAAGQSTIATFDARLAAATAERTRLAREVERAAAEVARAEAAGHRAAAARTARELAAERLASATREQERAAADLVAAQSAVAEVARLDAEIAARDAERGELEALDRIADAHGRRDELDAAVAVLRAQAATGLATIATLSRRAADEAELTASVARLEAAVTAAGTTIETSESDRGELRARLARARERVTEIDERLAAVARGEGCCPTCGQAIADAAALTTTLTTERATAEAEAEAIRAAGLAAKEQGETATAVRGRDSERLAAARTALTAAAAATVELRAERAAQHERETRIAGIDAEITAIATLTYDAARHARLRERAAETIGLGLVAASTRPVAERAPALAADVALMDERVAALVTTEAEAAAAAVAAGDDPAALVAATTLFEAATAGERAAERGEAEIARERAVAAERLARAESDLADHARLAAEIEEMATRRAALERTREAMERFKVALIGRVRPSLERKASTLLGELSDGRYATLAIDEDYEIRFGTGADLAPISRASGGEEDLLNLCLRLAISELIIESTGVGRTFVFLDEIFAYQDADRADRIGAALERLTARFGQVIVISHLPSTQDRYGATIEIRYDPAAGVSTVRHGTPTTTPTPLTTTRRRRREEQAAA